MKRRADTSWTRFLDYIVFLVLVLAVAGHKSVAYGFAFGSLGTAVLLGCIFLGVVLAALTLHLFFRNAKWTSGVVFTYLALAAGLATAIAFTTFRFADQKFKINQAIGQAKIEYFCADHFNHAECVYNVRTCPDCAKRIIRYKRMKMADNLDASDLAIQKHIQELQKPRTPAGKSK